ncbi:MAG TPA: hypothetical protein VFR09_05530 [Alphaproteobacteria bacterium]|nr:hypothetical protein [Alphaproteobacteria bacterium]
MALPTFETEFVALKNLFMRSLKPLDLADASEALKEMGLAVVSYLPTHPFSSAGRLAGLGSPDDIKKHIQEMQAQLRAQPHAPTTLSAGYVRAHIAALSDYSEEARMTARSNVGVSLSDDDTLMRQEGISSMDAQTLTREYLTRLNGHRGVNTDSWANANGLLHKVGLLIGEQTMRRKHLNVDQLAAFVENAKQGSGQGAISPGEQALAYLNTMEEMMTGASIALASPYPRGSGPVVQQAADVGTPRAAAG